MGLITNISGTSTSDSTTPAGGATEVEITSPVDIKISDKINVTVQQQKSASRDRYMLDMAAKLYEAMNHSDTQSAKNNATNAIKYAMVFWNTACGWYADELAENGSKSGKYQFNQKDKP